MTATVSDPIELPATRSAPFRSLAWALAESAETGLATLTQCRARANGEPGKATVDRYLVTEIDHRAGRAFVCRKLSADGRPTGERHEQEFPDGGHPACSCPGFGYDGTRKADQRAGGRLSGSLGCKHLDITAALWELIGTGIGHPDAH